MTKLFRDCLFGDKPVFSSPILILFMSVAPKRSSAVFRKLEQDLAKLSAGPEARNVHRLRTGTRRLQILLGELSPGTDRNQKKLLKLLGRRRSRAGNVPDLDAQLPAFTTRK